MKRFSLGGLLVLTPLVICSLARADSFSSTFVGPSGGRWSTAGNWSPTGVPNNGLNDFDVSIVGPLVTFDLSSATINSLDLQDGSVVMGGPTAVPRNLTITGNLTGQGGGVSVFDGGTLSVGGSILENVTVTPFNASGLAALQANTIGMKGSVSLGAGTSTGNAILSGFMQADGSTPVFNSGQIAGTGFLLGISQLFNDGTISSAASATTNTLHIQATSFDTTNGTLVVGAGSTLAIESPVFANMEGTNLQGGNYQVAGNLTLRGNINTVGQFTQLNLQGAGQVQFGNTNALAGLGQVEGKLTLSAGAQQFIGASTVRNDGTISVVTNSLLSLQGILQNNAAGTVVVDSGSTLRSGGALNNGILNAQGTIDLRGNSIDSFENLSASDETLRNGTYIVGANGTLMIDVGSGAHGGAILHIGDTANLTLSGGQIMVDSGADALALLTSNAGSLTVNGGNYTATPVGGTFSNTGTMTVDQAGFNVNGSFLNSGTVNLTQSTLNISEYTQTAGMTDLTFGDLLAPLSRIEGGILTGPGTVGGDLDNSGGSVIVQGGQPNLVVHNNYSQEAGGTLVESLGSGSYLTVDGNVALSGMFDGLADFGGTAPFAGETFEVLHFNGSLTGDFSSLDLPTLDGYHFVEQIGPHDVVLDVVSGPAGSAAPEPSYMSLAGAAMIGLGWKRRGRADR